jgi:F-type H+-transporting ATPase subunit delta
MDAAEDARLKKLISSHLGGGSMEYVSKIDPSLIGGFSVNIGSEKLDASVKNELKQLQLRLLGH